MKQVIIRNPEKLVFGPGSFNTFLDDCISEDLKRLLVITIPEIEPLLSGRFEALVRSGLQVETDSSIRHEPSFDDVRRIVAWAGHFRPDAVVGIGGGSVLDSAKMVSALMNNPQKIEEVVGSELLNRRSCFLVCIPTTSGTGSEVSPNAIFVDPLDGGKKGIISSQLVPDGAYVDPEMTVGMPPRVTASTGIDALTHCIEAYTNRFAHPAIDPLALEGCRLIGRSLIKACEHGDDLEARSDMALGSMYGGMCLGPVNTAAVHALAYPLGTTYKIPHGHANAIMLPHVMRFNIPSSANRYKDIALALGAADHGDDSNIAMEGAKIVEGIMQGCGLNGRLAEYNIKEDDIETLAEEALLIQRLLKNNPREVTKADAVTIYKNAL